LNEVANSARAAAGHSLYHHEPPFSHPQSQQGASLAGLPLSFSFSLHLVVEVKKNSSADCLDGYSSSAVMAWSRSAN